MDSGLSAVDPPDYSPAVTEGDRYSLWLAGEVFSADRLDISTTDAFPNSLPLRRGLLHAILREDYDIIARVDGEFQIALWDSHSRRLRLINDRFGGLTWYWAQTKEGFAFADGVRGVLLAPGVSPEPDLDAIRESVTFGGFRLGDRTNVRQVKKIPPASVVTVRSGTTDFTKYWDWSSLPPVESARIVDYMEQAHHLWGAGIRKRLIGAQQPGQLLSGGLDSRAILAEAAPQSRSWNAITFGIPGCDDAFYAKKVAEAMNVDWTFVPLYQPSIHDWLDTRLSFVQQTDGLIDLHDLKYMETVRQQRSLMDVHLSGYIGDAVAGPTFNNVATPVDILHSMPFYDTPLGLGYRKALDLMEDVFSDLKDAPPRFALFDHKLQQSTNHWISAMRPWVTVRKPFTDYAFFDFFQGLPAEVRGKVRLYERWLRSAYPKCFSSIPNQKTGVPIGTPRWIWQLERARRFSWRKVLTAASKHGMPFQPRVRNYTADEIFFRTDETKSRVIEILLRPGALCVQLFGSDAVTTIVNRWFANADVPVLSPNTQNRPLRNTSKPATAGSSGVNI